MTIPVTEETLLRAAVLAKRRTDLLEQNAFWESKEVQPKEQRAIFGVATSHGPRCRDINIPWDRARKAVLRELDFQLDEIDHELRGMGMTLV